LLIQQKPALSCIATIGISVLLIAPHFVSACVQTNPPPVLSSSVSSPIQAAPSTHHFRVDGYDVNLPAYRIAGNNYVKLRDFAAVVTVSDGQFDVSWDGEQNVVALLSNKPYSRIGNELQPLPDGNIWVSPAIERIQKDGIPVTYTGYIIGSDTYYKLRDVALSFNIGLTWDALQRCIDISTYD